MTKTKTKRESPELTTTEKEQLAENLARLGESSGNSFLKRCSTIFFSTVYSISLFFFGALFGILATLLLPFFLPFSYLAGAIKGNNPIKSILKR